MAELFATIANVSNALSVLAFVSLALGSFWWSADHECGRLWLGWALVGVTFSAGALWEMSLAAGSNDELWLMKSLQFQGGERAEGQVERAVQQCRNGWGTFNLGAVCLNTCHTRPYWSVADSRGVAGLWIGLQFAILTKGAPCHTGMLSAMLVFLVCTWLRLGLLLAGSNHARERKGDVMCAIAGHTGTSVRTWWQGPGRKPVQLLGELGGGRSGFLVLFTWL